VSVNSGIPTAKASIRREKAKTVAELMVVEIGV
jgi:hypothetical protein